MAARKALYRITVREGVPMVIYNEDAYGRVAGARDLHDQTLRFNIAAGSIDLHGCIERAEIDGRKLVEYLGRQTPAWERRLGKHNWLLAERLARDLFEILGCQFSNLAIVERCRLQYVSTYPDSPDLDQSAYMKLIADLRREYDSDE
jgi:hypothetical protein